VRPEPEPEPNPNAGNITGSNSVNVFLGLGLPWMLAALYWSQHAEDPTLAAQWHARHAHWLGLGLGEVH